MPERIIYGIDSRLTMTMRANVQSAASVFVSLPAEHSR